MKDNIEATFDGIQLDKNNIPESIAIIMDGNGRWAQEKGLPRSSGHIQGVENVTRITSECARLGVKFLTMYTFSTENWNRPEAEVGALMQLVADKLEDEIFMKNDVRFRYIGDIERLPAPARKRVLECMENTKNNKRMTAVTALNYSSRWEITKTMRDAVKQALTGNITPEDINEQYISEHLETNFMSDPDLLIRTGGELRISNYLLWQCAYSEFYFCDTFWPDFQEKDLHKAIAAYQQRQRRFGKTGEQVTKG
ncbi:MAG: isoprenyl transferase [Bacteroidaceae bacterium]|nr:isoprenyl transferase [Bacteroidaceae bacterium]MBQ5714579.1 isoprenyl transferase [Bacteroidaceae bacterium]